MRSSRRSLIGAAVAATALTMVGCGSDSPETTSGGDARVEIRVATFPPGADAAAYEAFAAQEKQFEDANPGIDVIGVEYEWEGPTFAVQLAGGSLVRAVARLHQHTDDPLGRLLQRMIAAGACGPQIRAIRAGAPR